MYNDTYKAVGNMVQNRTDHRKSENELLVKNDNWAKMVGRAKNLVRNVPVSSTVKNTFEVYCGCLTPVEGREESLTAFGEWAKHAGLESGQSLTELIAQIVGTMTWGDCLVILASDPYAMPGKISSKLKIIDPLQVSTPPRYRDNKIISGVRVVLGVALDKNDIELGYFVRKAGTDGNVDSDFTYVPRYLKSGRFYSMLVRAPGSHFPGQVRSFPMLSSSMDTVDLLSQLTEAASKESITKSAASVMLETEFPPDSGGKLFVDDEKKDAEESKPKNNLPKLNLEDIKPGDIIPLPPGTKPHVIENSATLQLVEQNKQQLKIVAGTLGIPYATLMSDFEKMSFSSCKMMMSKLFLLINLWNYGPIMRLFIEIFREVCLEYYLLKSILPNTEWLSCNWQGQEQPDPDPVKSANADKIRRQEGVKTRSDIVAGKGDDYRALVMQIKYERDIEMEVLGMPMDEFLNIKKSKSETEEPDDDDDDSEDE